jgi:hypothetical protein
MLDKIVKTGASWDWVSPLMAFIQSWWNRPSVGFNVSHECGFSAWQIERFLKSKGIKVWGVMVIDDVITLRVHEAQALYAQYWLNQMGVPYQGGISAASAAKYRQPKEAVSKTSPPQRKELGSIVNAINNIADRIG